jgi:prepilin-type N-terminal cleavage/methylation domain-containing protein
MRTLKFLNQAGMTLVEILIASALMGGVGLIAAKLMSDQSNNQAYLKNSADVAQVILKIESLMSNPLNCKQMLGGKTIGTLVPDAPANLGTNGVLETILAITTPTGAVVNILGEAEYDSYSIPDNGFKLQRSRYGGSITDLIITFDMKSSSIISRHEDRMIKRIPFVSQDNAGVITNCGPVLNDAESVGQKKMCDSLGGAATWNGTKCVINERKCLYGQVVTRMNSLGDVVCEDLASQVNLNELFDVNPVNCIGKPNIQIVNNGGKFKVICNP